VIYFSSDQHYWHQNVIKYCSRPYPDAAVMNEDMILKWNSIVKLEDTVYNLGDFSLAFRAVETYAQRLMGTKLLVPGNHDFCHSYHKKSRSEENRAKWIQKYEEFGFKILPEQTVVDLPGIGLVRMCHHPYAGPYEIENGGDKYAKWRPEDDGKILICGHVHEKWRTRRSPKGTLMINVGVDVNGYAPVSLDELIKIVQAENAT
jgi:calcineurin-like phosphoesterase family protein